MDLGQISLVILYWHNKTSWIHYIDVIMIAIASQITGVSIVCSVVCSGVDQRKYQSSSSLVFVRGIHPLLVDSPNKGPVTWKMFPFNDVFMRKLPTKRKRKTRKMTHVTHVPWCMSGSLSCNDGENVPGIPGACAPAILRIWQEAHYVHFGTHDSKWPLSSVQNFKRIQVQWPLLLTWFNFNPSMDK